MPPWTRGRTPSPFDESRRGGQAEIRRESHQRELRGLRGRRHEEIGRLKRQHQDCEGPNRHRASRVPRVNRSAGEQHPSFQQEGYDRTVPETEAYLVRVAPKRKVGDVHQQVDKPVRQHAGSDSESATTAPDEAREPTDQQCPDDRGREAVGIGHVVEVQWARCCEPRRDPHLLDSSDDEQRPEHVDELDGKKKCPKRHSLGSAAKAQARPIVSNEHCPPTPSRRLPASSLGGHVHRLGVRAIPTR